jgi:hypothetical protein
MLIAALMMFALSGCKKSKTASTGPLPDSNEIAGWARSADVRSFDAANLWQYIDGDAEKYIKAGVKGVTTAEYKFQGRIEAVADVYTMNDADGAKRVFDLDPAGDSKPVALGDAARQFKQSVIFRKGPSLVRVVAYQETPETPQALLDLAKGIERKLGN